MVASNLSRKRDRDELPSEEKLRDVRNSERDLHKHFVRLGLSLPVPIRKLEHTLSDGASVVTEYMNPSDWLSLLLKRYPQLIAGGASPLEDQLEGFWEAYRLQHPSHEVFQKQCQLGHVVPSAFGVMRAEGPEGVATWKVPLSAPLVFQSRMLIALAVIHSSLCPATGPQQIDCLTPKMRKIDKLGTNYYGHSFLKRYYLFGLPGYLYDGKPGIIEQHLEVVAADLVSLFNTGVFVGEKQYFGALIASKGDMKFQSKTIAWMNRSYNNLGTRNHAGICSLCKAGEAHIPMEDVQLEPQWKSTMYLERPWSDDWVPAFTKIPFDPARPEWLYKLDFFHCFKVGLGRDLVGSGLVWLCELGIFDYENSSQNIDDRLCRCHSHFKLWALTEKYSPARRSFTKSFMNRKTSMDAAWSNSKGSDTMILLKYLRFQLSLVIRDAGPAVAQHVQILTLLRDVVDQGIQMCDLIYSHNILLPRKCASRLYLHIMVLIRGYKRVAAHCLQHNFSGFRLKAKLHAIAHIGLEIREGLKTAAARLLNPVIWACELNEDHIGHVARVSRKLATKTLGLRMAQRYLLKSKAIFRRHFAKQKFTKPRKG